MRFQAILRDLVNKKTLVWFPVIRAASHREAMHLALKRLKRRRIYKSDADIREFARISEIESEFNPAGFEFDVLPEALRRFFMDVRVVGKTEGGVKMEELKEGMEVRIVDSDGKLFTAKVLSLREKEIEGGLVTDVELHVHEHGKEGWIFGRYIADVVKDDDGTLKILKFPEGLQEGH